MPSRISAGWVRLVLAVALLVLVLPSPTALSQIGPGASLTVVRGSVSVARPDGTAVYPAGTGLTLAIGDIVGTLDRTQAIVTFFSGSEVELGSNTTIVIRQLDRDLLDQANVTIEHLTGMTVIRVPIGGRAPVRVLSGDTTALVRSGEAGHGVDPVTNNITVACLDGSSKCSPNGVAFPTETAFLPGQMIRVLTGRGDQIDLRASAGSSIWDLLAEGGAFGQEDGTASTRRIQSQKDDDDNNPTGPRSTPTATVVATATPPAGIVGPPCNTPTLSGGAGVTTTVHSIGRSAGTLRIDWNAFPAADQFQIFYEGALIFDSGLVANVGFADVPFGPGMSTFIQVVVTTGPGSNQWTYTISCLP